MEVFSDRYGLVRATAVERVCGGWLVVSAAGAVLRVGVEGNTRTEAEARFVAAISEWTARMDERGETPQMR